jgi:hypothetical protein
VHPPPCFHQAFMYRTISTLNTSLIFDNYLLIGLV